MKHNLTAMLLALSLSSAVAIAGGAGGPPEASGDEAPSRVACSVPKLEATTAKPLVPTPFRGYPAAYVLHNDRVHAVVVPAISRLVFLAPSADAPNLLRLDDALADAGALPPDPSTAPDFFNIGGDWVWPVAQSNWPAFSPNAADWPPPPALADGPASASAWTDQFGIQNLLLTRHYPAPIHATLTREFILGSTATALKCGQTLVRDSDAPGDAFPLTLWHISQTANPNRIIFTVPSADFTPAVMAGALPSGSFSIRSVNWCGGPSFMGTYTPLPASEVKFSIPSSSLDAATSNGRLAVHASFPAHAELYSNSGLGYAELETVTPESSNTLSNTLTYFVSPPPDKESCAVE